jgi:cholesterol transport system auxiliary component
MIHSRAVTRALAALSFAGLLSGCISVLPKEPPAQLYRFGDGGPSAPAAATAPATPRFTVEALPLSFDRPAGGDAILTLTGSEAAYIKGSRWVASAQTLFESAVTRAFEAGGAARLMVRGEPSRPDYLLKLDVLRFETDYDQGQAAAPTIVVEMNATLSRSSDHALAGDRLFQARVTAGYDQATLKVLTDLVAWVDVKGGSPR